MEIKLKREKEFTKRNVKLKLSISAALSEEERALVEKYYSPPIRSYIELKDYFSSEEVFKTVKVDWGEDSSLGHYKLVAHVDDGFNFLSNIEKLEEAVISELREKLNYLRSLDKWEGEEVVTA